MPKKENRDGIKGSYNNFVNSPAGVDFLNHTKDLQQQYVSAAMDTDDKNKKAFYIDRAAGVVLVRDYILRQSGAASVRGESTLAPSKGDSLTLNKN